MTKSERIQRIELCSTLYDSALVRFSIEPDIVVLPVSFGIRLNALFGALQLKTKNHKTEWVIFVYFLLFSFEFILQTSVVTNKELKSIFPDRGSRRNHVQL